MMHQTLFNSSNCTQQAIAPSSVINNGVSQHRRSHMLPMSELLNSEVSSNNDNKSMNWYNEQQDPMVRAPKTSPLHQQTPPPPRLPLSPPMQTATSPSWTYSSDSSKSSSSSSSSSSLTSHLSPPASPLASAASSNNRSYSTLMLDSFQLPYATINQQQIAMKGPLSTYSYNPDHPQTGFQQANVQSSMDYEPTTTSSSSSSSNNSSSQDSNNGHIKPSGKRKAFQAKRWTLEEHIRFLLAMLVFKHGQWKEISEQMVITKRAKQVQSHAQKFFVRQSTSADARLKKTIHDFGFMEMINSLKNDTALRNRVINFSSANESDSSSADSSTVACNTGSVKVLQVINQLLQEVTSTPFKFPQQQQQIPQLPSIFAAMTAATSTAPQYFAGFPQLDQQQMSSANNHLPISRGTVINQ